MHRRCGLTSCSLLLLIAGCSTYQAPLVRVGDASLGEVTDEAMRVDVGIELENPNSEALELRSVSYTLSVDGRPVYTGKRAAEATLAKSAVKTMSIPAVVRYDRVPWDAAAPPAEAAWSITGKVLYVTPGEFAEILLDTKLRRPTVEFSGGGVVGLR